MEFLTTKYSYYLPFKSNTGAIEGLKREHISFEGTFLDGIHSPNQITREFLREIKVDYKNTKNLFNFYIGNSSEFESLGFNENSKEINTKITLKVNANSQSIEGCVYLSSSSFNDLKSLLLTSSISDSYLKFETIVYGDKIKNKTPIEIEFHSHTCGIELINSVTQKS
jgi:hypothetical protein